MIKNKKYIFSVIIFIFLVLILIPGKLEMLKFIYTNIVNGSNNTITIVGWLVSLITTFISVYFASKLAYKSSQEQYQKQLSDNLDREKKTILNNYLIKQYEKLILDFTPIQKYILSYLKNDERQLSDIHFFSSGEEQNESDFEFIDKYISKRSLKLTDSCIDKKEFEYFKYYDEDLVFKIEEFIRLYFDLEDDTLNCFNKIESEYNPATGRHEYNVENIVKTIKEFYPEFKNRQNSILNLSQNINKTIKQKLKDLVYLKD